MKKPVLVVMAAGMGSRYGGLKQIDPIDKEGSRFFTSQKYPRICSDHRNHHRKSH